MSRFYTHGAGRTGSPDEETELEEHRPFSEYSGSMSGARPLRAHEEEEYYETGEEIDDNFDVRADFDGDGPRWSEMYGVAKEASNYRPVYDHIPPAGEIGATRPGPETMIKEELVSVPVLGPEWQKSELHEMSRRGVSEAKQQRRTLAWRAWNRGQRGTCGIPWLTRRVIVFLAFIFVAALAVTLYFTIPRAVSFSFYEPSPFTVDNTTIVFNRTPTNFSFNANLYLLADASSSYLPVHFTGASATVYDLTTSKVIATGEFGDHTIAHANNVPIIFPVTFAYSAINDSDTTWNDMYDACEHEWTGVTRPDLKFRLEVQMSIMGLTTKPTSETQLSGITCPFELSTTSV